MDLTGIDSFCPSDGPCIPGGQGDFGWIDLTLRDAFGIEHAVRRLTWSEGSLPDMIKNAREALESGESEFRVGRQQHTMVVDAGQIPLLIAGLTGYLEHQVTCPNRRCP